MARSVIVSVMLGVWAAFWGACALVAMFGGDMMGLIAFGLIALIPGLWFTELTGTGKRGTEEQDGTEYTGT